MKACAAVSVWVRGRLVVAFKEKRPLLVSERTPYRDFPSADEGRRRHSHDLVRLAIEHGLQHPKTEALGLLELDFGWHDEFLPISQDIDDCRAFMCKGCCDRCFQLARVFHAHAINTHRLGHTRKIRIVEPRAGWEKSAGLHLDVDND